ncbi:MAG: Com family DNA-binding transcriptional regulator [Deferribacterales bacterium]
MKEEQTVKSADNEKEYRCPNCSKLLMKGDVNLVQIKCPRCKNIVTFKRQVQ